MADKIVKASIDRFEDVSINNNYKKYAIIYSDNYPNKKYDVPIELLEKNNIIKQAGIRVILYLDENNEIIRLEYDKENTEKSKKRIKTKLKRLLSGRHLKANRT
jgi:Protein of unknown function (DUF3006)